MRWPRRDAASTAARDVGGRALRRDGHDVARVGRVAPLELGAVGCGQQIAADPVENTRAVDCRDAMSVSRRLRRLPVVPLREVDRLAEVLEQRGDPGLAAGDVLAGVSAGHADPADDFTVDLDRPAADEDRESTAVHVHDAERLLPGLGVGVRVRRAPVARGGERLVDRDLDARRLAVVGPFDDERPSAGIAHANTEPTPSSFAVASAASTASSASAMLSRLIWITVLSP